jgi:hypothetical protein
MKHAVSISIGHSKRDKKVVINLLGQKVTIERRCNCRRLPLRQAPHAP